MPESKERFTPPIWTMHHIGGMAWSINAPARNDIMVAVVTSGEADTRLIVEAPNMFALLKEFFDKDQARCAEDYDGPCSCPECIATRRLMQRVLGSETN